MRRALLAAGLLLLGSVLFAQQRGTPKAAAGGNAAKIRQATSAAPADVGKGAAVVEMNEKMESKPLRAGTNGWTCMIMPAGAGVIDSMCMDKTWMTWANAYMAKKDPPAVTTLGVAYMLHGDLGASNTVPFAESPTPSNQWVGSPPHVMLLLPDPKALEAMPTDPHTGGAWVMWKGTKYAHVMLPMSAVQNKP